MARGAWIGHFVFFRHGWRDESKRMSMDIRARNAFRFDLRHMAGDALTPWTTVFMVGVRFKTRCTRPIRRHGAVTVQTDLIRRLDKLGVVRSAMYIVAGRTSNAMPIHDALRKVVALHPVFMRRAVREIIEIGLSKSAVFEPPEVL